VAGGSDIALCCDVAIMAEEVGFKQAVRERDSGAPIAEGVSRPLSPYRKSVD